LPTLSYSEDDNETVANIMANVNTYVNEMSQKWVLGAEPIEDTYDEFISTIKEFGIEQVIEIQQKAYDDLNN
jgi:putative aldouronate transport system substrate-binding protein